MDIFARARGNKKTNERFNSNLGMIAARLRAQKLEGYERITSNRIPFLFSAASRWPLPQVAAAKQVSDAARRHVNYLLDDEPYFLSVRAIRCQLFLLSFITLTRAVRKDHDVLGLGAGCSRDTHRALPNWLNWSRCSGLAGMPLFRLPAFLLARILSLSRSRTFCVTSQCLISSSVKG